MNLNYFKQTDHGNSRWWTWPTVFWCMLMSWILGQLALTSGFGNIAFDISPELGQTYQNAAMAMFEDQEIMIKFGLYSLGFMIFALIGIIFLPIAYFSTGTAQKIMGIIAGVGIGVSTLFLILLAPMAGGTPELSAAFNALLGGSPLAYALMLLTFPAALIGLYLGQKHIHRRTLTSLHTGLKRIRWGRIIKAFFVMWIVLATFGVGINYLMGGELRLVFDPARFFGYAIISLLLLPIQSATEEIVFRGYLNQGLMRYLKNKWVVFTITSLLFMAMHLANPEAIAGAEKGILPIVMSGYFFFGFACCLMILIDDGLESAIGVHAGNNTFAALFVNYENSVLPTPSVFVTKANPVLDSISTILILSVVLIILYLLNKRQKDRSALVA